MSFGRTHDGIYSVTVVDPTSGERRQRGGYSMVSAVRLAVQAKRKGFCASVSPEVPRQAFERLRKMGLGKPR